MRKKFITFLTIILFMVSAFSERAYAAEEAADPVGIEAPHALLMEVSTGEILYEKDADTAVPPASVTKIMTMLLIFEALEDEKISLGDQVTTSEKAASMGGSQVYLEPGEKQTVEDLLKCIAIASANDACVAMAEYVSGSEEAFVGKMNERAKELGMENTHFVNCNGLDADGHLVCAKDVAIMSRELLQKHPEVHEYCTIWMDTITHHTARGDSEFGLNNTNKLLKQYTYATGLKTGSTGNAGFCVSASARKDGMGLIAVIMNGETSKSRFADAATLLSYGYANYQLYLDTGEDRETLDPLPVRGGVEQNVKLVYEKEFSYLLMNGENLSDIERKIELPEELTAPVAKGEQIGTLTYYHGNEKLGEIGILAETAAEKAGYLDYVARVWLAWTM